MSDFVYLYRGGERGGSPEHSQPFWLPIMGKNSTRVALDNVVDSK